MIIKLDEILVVLNCRTIWSQRPCFHGIVFEWNYRKFNWTCMVGISYLLLLKIELPFVHEIKANWR